MVYYIGWGYRHLLAFLAFLGFFNVYCMRVNLSVAMVNMVKPEHKDVQNSTSDECQDHSLNSTKTNVSIPVLSLISY